MSTYCIMYTQSRCINKRSPALEEEEVNRERECVLMYEYLVVPT